MEDKQYYIWIQNSNGRLIRACHGVIQPGLPPLEQPDFSLWQSPDDKVTFDSAVAFHNEHSVNSIYEITEGVLSWKLA